MEQKEKAITLILDWWDSLAYREVYRIDWTIYNSVIQAEGDWRSYIVRETYQYAVGECGGYADLFGTKIVNRYGENTV